MMIAVAIGAPYRAIQRAVALAVVVAAAWLTPAVHAVPILLQDLNSTVVIDPTGGAGMFQWQVDGVNQLGMSWLWYRVGNGAERPIDTLPLISAHTADTNTFDDPAADLVTLVYEDAQQGFRIQVRYALGGGMPGSGVADMAEVVRVDNLSGQPLEIHLFELDNFDLRGTAADESVSISNGNTASQSESGSLVQAEVAATPQPPAVQAGVFSDLLAMLNDDQPDTLDGTTQVSQTDAAWAFQWQLLLTGEGGGSSFLMSKNKHVEGVPEPATLAMLALGAATAGRRRRSQSA